MKVKGHHIYLGGIGTGLLLASWREWLLMAVVFLAGILFDRLLLNWRSAKDTARRLIEGREKRANINTVLRRRASERADVRLALAQAKRTGAYGGPGELPEEF